MILPSSLDPRPNPFTIDPSAKWGRNSGPGKLGLSDLSSILYLEDQAKIRSWQRSNFATRMFQQRKNLATRNKRRNLKSATTTTSLLPVTIWRNWSTILDSANLHPCSGEGSESGLCSGSGSLGSVSSGSSELDMERGDAEGFNLLCNILGGQHSGVGRGFVTVSLHLHSTGNPVSREFKKLTQIFVLFQVI